MSDILKNLAGHLRDNAGVAALVGTDIFRGIAPQQAGLPRITLNLISTPERVHGQGGASGLVLGRIQVDCWGSKKTLEHSTLADEVRDAIDGLMHTTIGDDDLAIKSITLDDAFDDYTMPTGGDANAIPRVIQEYLIWYAESIPALT